MSTSVPGIADVVKLGVGIGVSLAVLGLLTVACLILVVWCKSKATNFKGVES